MKIFRTKFKTGFSVAKRRLNLLRQMENTTWILFSLKIGVKLGSKDFHVIVNEKKIFLKAKNVLHTKRICSLKYVSIVCFKTKQMLKYIKSKQN